MKSLLHCSRTLGLSAAAVALSLVLTGCQVEIPAPNDAAQQLADSLNTGDFSELPQTPESVAPDLESAFAALSKAERTVTLTSVTQDEREEEDSESPITATATYETTWDLTGLGTTATTWDYSTEAQLVYDEEDELWKATVLPELAAPKLDEGEKLSYRVSSGTRGKILGSTRESIVEPRPVYVVGIDKTQVTEADADASARALAATLQMNADEYAAKVAASGEKAFVEAATLRTEDFDPSSVSGIDGALAQESTLPLAKTRSFARTVVGHVGEPTAEQVEAAEKDGETLPLGVMIGQAGLQKTQNDTLAGTYGLTIYTGSDPVLELDPTAGKNVVSSINAELQEAAESVIANHHSHTALVAIRPSDGAVLAAAVGPRGSTTPTATQSRFAPGSTFKLVTALGMLREGVTPNTTVQCPNTTSVNGQVFKNFDGYPSAYLGAIPFKEAIAQSCNTVFADAWNTVTGPRLGEAAAALGLNPDANTGLDVFMASVPEDSETNLQAANLFGQGVVETSVLGMATVAASIAAGKTVTPNFVLEPELEETKAPAKPLTAEEAKQLKSMMAGTVTHGTVPILQDVPGEQVQAKTGTAEFGTPDGIEAHTWVIAIHGDLAMAVFVEIGEYGAETNGPLAKDFLTRAHTILQAEEEE